MPRPSTGDVVLALLLVVLGQLTTWLHLDSADAFAGPRWVNAVVLALGTVPALWRRSAPLVVVAVSASFLCLPHAVAELDVTVLGQFLPLVVITASCGYYARARTAALGAAIAVAGMLLVSLTTPFLRTPTSLVFNLVVLLAPWAAARALRHREERAQELGAALEHERAQFEDRMAEAVERERAAIARDLHDIVAHGVSVMVVQIGGARMQAAEDPARASESLLQAEEAGRQALADLRRMLGVLRASPTTGTEPRPGLRDLEALVAMAAAAGLRLDYRVIGRLEELPAAVDISAYRIVQEALTNVIKHSGATRADLRVEAGDRELRINVRDFGRGRHEGEGEGYGLIGIRERVAFLGGQAHVGPATDGGWEVAVTIPTGVVGSPPPAPPLAAPAGRWEPA